MFYKNFLCIERNEKQTFFVIKSRHLNVEIVKLANNYTGVYIMQNTMVVWGVGKWRLGKIIKKGDLGGKNENGKNEENFIKKN